MGIQLQQRIERLAATVPGDCISIPELVTALPDVNAESLAAALIEMTKIGRISVSGIIVNVMADRKLLS